MPKSLKEPIERPIIPISDDQETIIWLANWLNNRREQLYNNIKDGIGFNDIYTYSKPENLKKGDIRDDGWDWKRIDLTRNPLEYVRGNNPERISVNKAYYSQINSAASAPQIILQPDKQASDFSTRGAYVVPNNWNNTGHYIAYPGVPSNDIKVHERTHAMNADPQEKSIRKVIDSKNSINDNKYNDKYLDNEKEIYARLNQYRIKNNLKPTDIIDKEYLNTHKKELEDLQLDRYDEDVLLYLFNEIAQNTNTNNQTRKSLEEYYYG